MNVIAVIPARGGSKRIPRKNIKSFSGLPMLARTIINAKESELFSNIYVTSEDAEILKIANDWGAETILRPKKLSDDYATTVQVIKHSSRHILDEKDTDKTVVCCLYPATPLLNYSRVKQGIEMLLKEKCDYVLPIKKTEFAASRSFKIQSNGKLQLTSQGTSETRTQDLESTFFDTGQFYVGLGSSWIANKTILSNNSIGLLLGKYEVLDIDDLEDWEFAQELYSIRNKQ